jgi:hypothetical protein
MERFSTKTDKEREDEETERLVRESPKVKPPRHDKMRERVSPDKDPDLDEKDEDLSKNYKDVGGSIHSARTKNKDLITVRLKEDPKQVVQINKKTLQAEPGKYEEIKEEKEAPEPKPKPKPGKPPREKKPSGDAKASQALNEMAKNDSDFATILKNFTNPKSQWAKAAPETPLDDKLLQGRTLPKGIETVGDLQRVLKVKKTEAPEEAAPEKVAPKKKAPRREREEEPRTAPGAPTRPFSHDELNAAHDQLRRTFPTEVRVDIMLSRPPMHPDEINALVADYHIARSLPAESKDVDKLRKDIKTYTTDPNQVPPPKFIEDKSGAQVKFEDLPEEEQAEAHRRHQVQTVAMNLAAREAASENIAEKGVPKDLADSLAGFMLSGRDENPSARLQRANKEAERLFYSGLEAVDPKPVPPEVIEKVLKKMEKDPTAKKLAVAYFQARDYQDARKRFLDPASKEHVSEYQSPKAIANGLEKAMKFLREQTERYPQGTSNQDTATTFRARVMRHLSTLAPDKESELQELMDEVDNRHYDQAMKKHKKAASSYKGSKMLAALITKKKYDKYSERLRAGEDPDPPMSSEDWLAARGTFEPKEPVKPTRYDVQRKNPEEVSASAQELWKSFGSRTGRSQMPFRVVGRCLSDPFFIYSNTSAMDVNRQAVYWGKEPDDVDPYPQWEQHRNQDLTDRDFHRLLTAAREWLKTPVLSTNIEGIVRDTQLRAALDLAIRAEGYDHALHPVLYENLLAYLAGKPQDEPLLTVTAKTAREEMSDKKVVLDPRTTDRILARLDRMAALVQEGHEKMGMNFDAARDLVNELDRVADELETAAYGEESLIVRQAQVLKGTDKTAEVIQREGDEPYMDTFSNPSSPIQTEADEPYMSAYGNDDSSGVHHGKSETGRPLAP